jgi:hypothetical protein
MKNNLYKHAILALFTCFLGGVLLDLGCKNSGMIAILAGAVYLMIFPIIVD